jgi:hypothetical protein
MITSTTNLTNLASKSLSRDLILTKNGAPGECRTHDTRVRKVKMGLIQSDCSRCKYRCYSYIKYIEMTLLMEV